MKAIAVCCGFNDYKKLTRLETAVNDATTLHSALMKNALYFAGLKYSKVITHEGAKAGDVLGALDNAVKSAADLIWFSFSGHGDVIDGELRLLLPHWTSDEDGEYSIGAGALETIIRLERHKRTFVCALDACSSGAFAQGVLRRTRATAVRRTEEAIAAGGAIVMSATAYDGAAFDRPASTGVNGAFTSALVETIARRQGSGERLTALELFFAASARVRETSAQTPSLYANGLVDDIRILDGIVANPEKACADGFARLTMDVPGRVAPELKNFVASLATIQREDAIGMVAAERQLERLSEEFMKYKGPSYTVDDFSSNVTEAYSNAKKMIVACTTPSYFDDWRDSGDAKMLLHANGEFIRERGGRVIRLFFVPATDYNGRFPQLANVLREHVRAGVDAVIVDVGSLPTATRATVFGGAAIDLKSLEFAFVDGRVFLKTIFQSTSSNLIEVDLRREVCFLQFKGRLQPFFQASQAIRMWRVQIGNGEADELQYVRLSATDVGNLKMQIEEVFVSRA